MFGETLLRPAAVLLGVLGIGSAGAQVADRIVASPPLLGVQRGVLPKTTLLAAPAGPRMTTKKALDLNVVYTDSSIYNPGTGRADKVRLRSYERYIGEFVLHCHILDHEDQGMMQNVRIDLPGGQGGTTHVH
jgi:Multicopper oxidase